MADDLKSYLPAFATVSELLKDRMEYGSEARIPIALTRAGGESFQPLGSTENTPDPVAPVIKNATVSTMIESLQEVRLPIGFLATIDQGKEITTAPGSLEQGRD